LTICGAIPLRLTATELLEAEKRFRRIKGYLEIELPHERLNPSRIQQKEVRTVDVGCTLLQVRPTLPKVESRCN
jgi:hypothetical protein